MSELISEARDRGWFRSSREVFVARAPARLDVMGGIADYSGSHVLEMPLDRGVLVGCGRRNDDKLRVLSFEAEKEGLKPRVEMSLSDLFDRSGSPRSYDELRKLFSRDPLARWAGYVLGAFPVLIREGIVKEFPCGADIGVRSDVPMGVGIASSAALEVASMFAIAACFGIELEPIRIARLCQIVENRIVGAPCGIMDQITSALGEKDKLIPILCQPDKLLEPIEIPDFIRFVGVSSKAKRSTAGEAYTETRTATFMGLTIIIRRFNPPINGYLCNISPQEFRSKFAPALPLRMKGEEFLRIYGDTVDTVTRVDPRKTYRVRSCAEHPIYENHRVKRFIGIMRGLSRFDTAREARSELIKAGRLMYASHWSYKYLSLIHI